MHPEFALGQAHAQGLTCAEECQFEDCDCPEGRRHFDPQSNKWRPSVDRILQGRDGGEYVSENVRRMHLRCNTRAANLHPGAREALARLNADPEYRRVRAEHLARLRADPEWQRNHAAQLARRNADPAQVERLARLCADPDWQRDQSERMARLNASPEHKEHIARLNADPEQQRARAERLAGFTPEFRRQQSCLGHRIRKGLPCRCGQHPPDAHLSA